MELRLLKSFCVLAEEEHFHRAAQRLNLAQPSLSAQIKQLEGELGESLFERHSRQVALTDAGRLLWDHAERVLREAEIARQALRELRGLERGRLSCGVVQTVKTCLAPHVVSRFLKQYPGISLDLQELSADEIESRLDVGKLDLGISFGPPRNGSLESESLFEEELVAIAPKNHPWARRRFIRFEEFASQTLALLSQGYCTRRLFDMHAAASGIDPAIAYETNSIESILLTLDALQAVTFLPSLAQGIGPFAGSLAAVPIRLARPEPITRQVALIYPRRRPTSRAALAFSELWREQTKSSEKPMLSFGIRS